MQDQSVNAVVTDPPYNVDFAEWDTIPDYRSWASSLLTEWKRISERIAFTPGLVNVGMWSSIEYPKWILAWHKPAAMKRSPFGFSNWDAILFYGKSVVTHGFTDVIHAPIKVVQYAHPSIKPLDLMRGIIERVSLPGDTIFDPFMGSGTTGVAAIQLGRKFIGCEKEKEYFEIAESRISQAVYQPSLFTASNKSLNSDVANRPGKSSAVSQPSLFEKQVSEPTRHAG